MNLRRVINFLTGRRPDAVTPAEAARIEADCWRRINEEDRLIREWMDGPGKTWPKVLKPMRMIETSPVEMVEWWADGWMEAANEYVRSRVRP